MVIFDRHVDGHFAGEMHLQDAADQTSPSASTS